MANIPTLMTGPRAQTQLPGRRATASDFGASNSAGEGLMRLAFSMADEAEKKKKSDDALWAHQAESDALRYWSEELERRKTGELQPGAKDFTASVLNDYANDLKERVKAAPSPEARAALERSLISLGNRIQTAGLAFEARQRVAWRTNTLAETIDKDGAALHRAPHLWGQMYERNAQMIANMPGLEPDDRASLKTKLEEITQAAITGFTIRDAKDALKRIDAGEFDGKIDSTKLATLRSQAQAKAEEVDYLARYKASQQLEAHVTSIATTGRGLPGFSIEGYASTFGKTGAAEAAQAQDRVAVARMTFNAITQLYGKNETQASEILQKLDPRNSATDEKFHLKMKAYEQISTTYAQLQRLKVEDPYAYSMADPAPGGLRERAEAVAKNNPGSQFLQDILNDSIAIQTKSGIPPWSLRAMSKSQSAQIVQELHNAPVDQVQQRFTQLKEQYGPYYDMVLRGLSDAGMDGRYLAVAMNLGTPAGVLATQALRVDKKTLDSSFQNDTEKRDLINSIRRNETVQNYMRAMTATGLGGADQANSIITAVEDVAKGLYLSGAASDIGKASKMAVDTMFGTMSFGAINGERFIIPSTKFNPDKVSQIIDNLQYMLGNVDPDPNQFRGFDPALTPEYKENKLKGALEQDGFWASTPDASGVQLMIRFRNGLRLPVKDKSGRPITYTFEQVLENRRPDPTGLEIVAP